ncbi:MAG: ferrous iron transporter B [Planctomycetota bacterium]
MSDSRATGGPDTSAPATQSQPDCGYCEPTHHVDVPEGALRVAILGNPNAGKTTLFNRLSGLRAKTSNFPGTTQEARVGLVQGQAPGTTIELIDLPGVYSLELEQTEAFVCREVLAGRLAPKGERAADPDAVLIVLDATNLARGLLLTGETLRRRLPTVIALNMIDLARRDGAVINASTLAHELGCRVVEVSARTGENVAALVPLLCAAVIPNQTPPGAVDALEHWAEELYARCTGLAKPGEPPQSRRSADVTDRIDAVTMHPLAGPVVLLAVMAGLFWSIFSLAKYPMDWIQTVFGALSLAIKSWLPPGILSSLISEGVVAGVGATAVFVPQICVLFFLMSLLEDTGYLARAAMLMDRLLRPFGLPGHAFVPLLGSHACALPGIMATRAIPNFNDRLATILVAPFMTCSARLPVYILLTTLLFKDRPWAGSLAFIGCYALGIAAGLLSSLLARRTFLRGASRPMILEMPTYKLPSIRTALLTTYDRGWMFLRNAGTNILAICVVMWWLGAYPHSEPPPEAVALHQQADALEQTNPRAAKPIRAQADLLEAKDAKARSFAGMLGRGIQPIFAPLGYDWQLSVGVVSSFAAREVFVSTLAVVTTGSDDNEDQGVIEQVQHATRDDGTPIFTTSTSWSLLVYYVLAMQCLPTLAVTAREAGGAKWAFLQLAWMCGLAYLAALVVRQVLLWNGIA